MVFEMAIKRVNKPAPHYRCFVCLRKIGYGYDRTARHFGVRRKSVHRWFKYHGINVERPSKIKTTVPIRVKKPRPAKKTYVKIRDDEWKLKYIRTRNKRKLTSYFRGKVWKCFRLNQLTKTIRRLIGCDREFFVNHIKSQLCNGMTMENYGRMWELDHIKPCCNYDLSDKEQRLECFHWTNYRPLCKIENRSRQRKIPNFKLSSKRESQHYGQSHDWPPTPAHGGHGSAQENQRNLACFALSPENQTR